ncbi:hypothetical protein PFISCL1PPCAC_9228, partial [Pristionchus fissidentatus]
SNESDEIDEFQTGKILRKNPASLSPLNDANLMHIAKHAKAVTLRSLGDFTGQGILDAWQAQFACSRGPPCYIYLCASDATVEELCRLI